MKDKVMLYTIGISEPTYGNNIGKATLKNGHVSVTVDVGTPWYGGIITYFRDDVSILRTKYEGDYTCRNIHTEGDNYQIKVIFEARGAFLRSGAGAGGLF